MDKPPFLLRVYAFLTFPWSKKGSLVWWWRMHANAHYPPDDPRCPYCATSTEQRESPE